MDAIIHMKNLSKAYHGKVILKDINFSIFPGQSIAFTGHNGSGKSTLLKLIAGLICPTSGSVEYLGRPLFHYIPERFPKLNLTVRQYLHLMGKIDGLTDKEFTSVSSQLFADFFIQDMVDIPMKHLSKGTLQKAGVIQALLKTPDILLLDEPLSGQDMDSQSVFIEKMNQLRARGVTLLMACHETFLVNRVSDVVCQIANGNVAKGKNVQEVQDEYYTMIFEMGTDAAMTGELRKTMRPCGAQYKLTVPASRTNSTVLWMLNHGWILKGMYYENTV